MSGGTWVPWLSYSNNQYFPSSLGARATCTLSLINGENFSGQRLEARWQFPFLTMQSSSRAWSWHDHKKSYIRIWFLLIPPFIWVNRSNCSSFHVCLPCFFIYFLLKLLYFHFFPIFFPLYIHKLWHFHSWLCSAQHTAAHAPSNIWIFYQNPENSQIILLYLCRLCDGIWVWSLWH